MVVTKVVYWVEPMAVCSGAWKVVTKVGYLAAKLVANWVARMAVTMDTYLVVTTVERKAVSKAVS